jgi:hypothetical protein
MQSISKTQQVWTWHYVFMYELDTILSMDVRVLFCVIELT